MVATAHALIGAAIATKAGNPSLGLIYAFFSHFILDLTPHWDEGLGWQKKTKIRLWVEAGIDIIASFALTYFFFHNLLDTNYLFLIIIAAQLPDWLEAPYLFLDWKFPPFSWIRDFQHKVQWRLDLPWGAITQLVVVLVALYFSTGSFIGI